MQQWVDYYSVLDVNQQARREDIEACYRKLCKLFHPDINHSPEAEGRMKQINLAWEVLRDEERRNVYHREWMRRQNAARAKAATPNYTARRQSAVNTQREAELMARVAVMRYFQYIKGQRYEDAYALLSKRDRDNITLDSFHRWQKAVSKAYVIEEFLLASAKHYDESPLPGLTGSMWRFAIEIEERDVRTGKRTRYKQIKFALLENAVWHVYLGYRNVDEVSERFSTLAGEGARTLREVTDVATGLPNRLGFLHKCRPEIYRAERYGRQCVLALLEVRMDRARGEEDMRRRVHLHAAFSLRGTLRLIDVLGALPDDRFIMLLAETTQTAADRAMERITACLKRDVLACLDVEVSPVWEVRAYAGDDLSQTLSFMEGGLM